MSRLLFPLLAVVLLDLALAAQEKPKPDDTRILALLVKAYNGESARELHDLSTADFQKELPLKRLEAVLRQIRTRYGKIPERLPEPTSDGNWRGYRVRGEKRELYLRVAIHAGKLAGLTFQPGFLADLPSTPLTLSQLQERLKPVVEQVLRDDLVPSISLALVKDDRLVWAKAFGYQNVGRKVPADTETLYVTGSIFKVVVASALMRLVDEGKLDLDAPVNSYLKKFQIENPYEKETPLTLRHLLSHHSGLGNGAQMVPLWRRELPTALEDLVKKRAKVSSKPGEKFAYSNYAFALNGWLLGEVEGSSFTSALRRRLLDPLEMTHTALEPTPALAENLAFPYQASSDGRKVVPAERYRLDVYPAGDLYSTPSDMARFLIMHLGGGKYAGQQILSQKAVEEMARPQFSKPDDRMRVGLGWMIGGGKTRRLWHNGAVPGFYTFMGILPEKKVGVVLFCNRFDPLAAALGVFQDPLEDLATFAFALLEKLETPVPEKR
jgi:CubicO group peptidase (beta-lactamase class C family)